MSAKRAEARKTRYFQVLTYGFRYRHDALHSAFRIQAQCRLALFQLYSKLRETIRLPGGTVAAASADQEVPQRLIAPVFRGIERRHER